MLMPTTIEETVSLLAGVEDVTLLSGGTDVMVEVNFNHRRPKNVISLRRVGELSTWQINHQDNSIFIGASVPYAEMEKGSLASVLPALAAAARTVGSPQIRAAGSLGGNLGTCSPAGDSLPVLSALDAIVHLASESGLREMSIHDFMVGPKRNARRSNELITGVTLPVSNAWQGYSKVGVRNAMVISTASACVSRQDGLLRIALGSVGPTIIRCKETETWANERGLEEIEKSPELREELSLRVSAESRPIDDHRSTANYRRHAVGVLARRLFERSTQS